MNRPLLDVNNIVVNVVSLPDDWTGDGDKNWQPAQGLRVGKEGGNIGDVFDGTDYIKIEKTENIDELLARLELEAIRAEEQKRIKLMLDNGTTPEAEAYRKEKGQ